VDRLDADEHPERSGAFQDRAKAVPLTGHAPGRVIRTDGVFATYAGRFSCACGWRADSTCVGGQVRIGAPAWPRKGAWLTVCPRASSPRALLHAPQAGWAGAFTRCICGWNRRRVGPGPSLGVSADGTAARACRRPAFVQEEFADARLA
jgi:hypothetical protein